VACLVLDDATGVVMGEETVIVDGRLRRVRHEHSVEYGVGRSVAYDLARCSHQHSLSWSTPRRWLLERGTAEGRDPSTAAVFGDWDLGQIQGQSQRNYPRD